MNQTPTPVYLDFGLSSIPIIQWETQISVDIQSVADFSANYVATLG